MRCDRSRLDAELAVERGARDLEHLLACRDCRRTDDRQQRTIRRVRELARSSTPPPTWQAQVFARIARERPVPTGSGWRRLGVVAYAAAVIALSAAVVFIHTDEVRLRDRADAGLRDLDRDLARAIATVEAHEAEDDLRYQLVHVAYAQIRAAAPDAGTAELTLARARQRALIQVHEEYRAALTRRDQAIN